ncbi:putative hydrolase (beta-lactamase-like) [Rhizocola hellebori]|uniref:Putative hydrolase (Beta-lactamase-like) n=1 Tax=Rhizocola hellebori TaxID=1392758 RepID=A0A8J3QFZ7_9ACTN|nr:MBL fold metallo-hydrolase [Rhizocola hellebori]GIH08990.1 putative hydrolase (beta-lactamase-like) [Rhizocola hellebori]
MSLVPEGVLLIRADNPGYMTLEGTNTWVLSDGTVIDPGPDDPIHLEAIARAGQIKRILVTHGHPDHVEGVDRLVKMTGAVVGEVPSYLREVKTPGHTADSVCFVSDSAVFTGDTILGRGSSVVAWPDGNVGDYLKSLETLMTFQGVPALPGHGPALPDCAQAARWLHGHRLERLEQVKAALAQGAKTPQEVVDMVYADVDPALKWAAEWSVRAQLDYLT